jgi:cytochrome c oxidase subunit II
VGRLFAAVLTVIALVSTALFFAHRLWLPADIAAHGPALDRQLRETLAATGVLFVAAQLALALFAWQSGERTAQRRVRTFPGGARPLVIAASVLVGVEILTLTLVGSKVWAGVYITKTDPKALSVDVQAEQFAFYFRYAGPDGKFGAIHPDKMDEASGNFFGLDPENDVAARDDIVAATLAIPVGRPVVLWMHAKDVSHAFYVPELRIQQDFVPGMDLPLRFTATRTGKFEIVCTQLCGLGHYNMKAYIEVRTQDDYDKWLKEQAGT